MKRLCHFAVRLTALLVAITSLSEMASAQMPTNGYAVAASTTRDGWKERVIRRGPSQAPAMIVSQAGGTHVMPTFAPQLTPPNNMGHQPQVFMASDNVQPETITLGQGQPITQNDITYMQDGMTFDMNPPLIDQGMGGYEGQGMGCGSCGSNGCQGSGACGAYDCGYWPMAYQCTGTLFALTERLLSNSNVFAGVQGFKNGADMGRNGSFGFHEGINWSGALGGPYGFGYQFGFQGVHSNFSGDQAMGARDGDRDQFFWTAGIFRRAVCGGLQGGIVYDALQDKYYDTIEIGQVRAELSFAQPGSYDIGFWGAFGTKTDTVAYQVPGGPLTLYDATANDVYAFFYRKQYCEGGEGRAWLGATSQGDFVMGTNMTLPLTDSLALQNSFSYLIPNEGKGIGGQERESWSLAAQLVWYPGRQARCATSNPFSPLFEVANNTWLNTDFR